ncbi:hypothetical protein AB1Y20_008154 [Prymnesium parvum]|uniref:Uncharacterized protein n=1 Tax=Prymnesium parvum TaxID=97485 RepID=A0AB34IWE2_PRYPA
MLSFLESAQSLTKRNVSSSTCSATSTTAERMRADFLKRAEARLLQLQKACSDHEQAQLEVLQQLSKDFEREEPPEAEPSVSLAAEGSESEDSEDEAAQMDNACASLRRVLDQPRWRI